MAESQTTALPPEAAARLTSFARSCKAAARAVSLYPAEHPAIGEALGRLARVAATATERGPLSVHVLPGNLLIDGRAPARPDAAVTDLAGLLHGHLVGEMTIQRDIEPAVWLTFLGLLTEDPADVRARGGIARAWMTAGGHAIELHELDYSGLARDRQNGVQASWETIIANCLQGDSLKLDEETVAALVEIARDPERLGQFFARTASLAEAQHTPGGRVGPLLSAMRGVTGFFTRTGQHGLDEVLDNMAAATAQLTPDCMMDLLGIGRDPQNEDSRLVTEITRRITDPTVAKFVAGSVGAERGCTSRLTDAFRALVPEPQRKKTVVGLAKHEVAATSLAADPGFDRIWAQVEDMLLSYTDERYIPEDYNLEMSVARSRAVEMENIPDDPPERVSGWLTTVSDAAVRALDLQLLLDLLAVESDASQRQEVLRLVVSHIDELVAIGDFEGARRLVDGLADLAGTAAGEAGAQARRAMEQLVAGQLMSQVAFHVNAVRDDEFDQIKALCVRVGPALVPRLAETLSTEERPRARQRMTDLLIAFGRQSRHSVDQLRQSANPGVRRTAVQLLRTFGGNEALPDLEQLMSDPDSSVQRDAVRAVIGMGTERAFQVVERILSSPAGPLRAAAIEELALTRDQRAAPLFCHIVRHVACRGPLRDVYLSALGRLGFLGGTEAAATLAEVLRSGTWWAPLRTRTVRQEAAAALAQIRLPAAAEALRDAAENGAFGVRAIARRYLRELE